MKFLKRTVSQKSSGGYSPTLHVILTAILPILIYILIRLGFGWAAVVLVLLSKWRMFAVKMRHWPANIRTNAVDIFVSLSIVIFMISSSAQVLQVIWVLLYSVWLLYIKPRSGTIWIGAQAIIAQALSLTAIYYYWSDVSTSVLLLLTWVVTYFCARHFFTAFDESMSRSIAYSWSFFAATVAWLSGHWLIFYGPIAQPALLLTTLGYGLASMYYLEHMDKLTMPLRRQFIGVMSAIVLFLIIFSDWTDKTI